MRQCRAAGVADADNACSNADGKSAVHYHILFIDVCSPANRTMGDWIHVSAHGRYDGFKDITVKRPYVHAGLS